MANTVQVTFEIDKDASGRTILKQIDRDIDKIGSTAKSTGRQIDGAFAVFKGTLAAEYFRRATSEAVNFARTAVSKINEVSNATLGLASVAAFKGISTEATTEAVQNLSIVKLGLVSTGDAARALKDLLTRFDLDQSITTLERFADIASVNRQNNLTLSESIITGAQAVKNLNSILLDNLGISRNISLITKERGFSMEDLDDPTKKAAASTAFFNGLLKETEPFMGKAQAVAGTFQGKLIGLDAAWNRLLETVGQVIVQNPQVNEGLNDVGRAVGQLIVELSNAESPTRKTVDTIVSGAGEIASALASLTAFIQNNSGVASTALFTGLGLGAGVFAGSKLLGLTAGVVNLYTTVRAAQAATAAEGVAAFTKMDIAGKAFTSTLSVIAAHPAIAALVAAGAVVSASTFLAARLAESNRDRIGSQLAVPGASGDGVLTKEQIAQLELNAKRLREARDRARELAESTPKTIVRNDQPIEVKRSQQEIDQLFREQLLKSTGIDDPAALDRVIAQNEQLARAATEKLRLFEAQKKLKSEIASPLKDEERQKLEKFVVGIRDTVRDAFGGLRTQLTRDNPFTQAFEQADRASDSFAQKVDLLGEKFDGVGKRFTRTFEEMNARMLALDVFKADLASTERLSQLLSEADALRNNPQISQAFERSEVAKRLDLLRRQAELDELARADERSRLVERAGRGGSPLALRDFDRQNSAIKLAAEQVRAILRAADGNLANSFQQVLDATGQLDFNQIESLVRSGDPFARGQAEDLARLRDIRRRAISAGRDRAIEDSAAVDPGVEAAKRAITELNKFDPTRFKELSDQRAAQAALLDKLIAVGQGIDPAKLTDELKAGRIKALEQRADLERSLKADAEKDRAETKKLLADVNAALGLLYKRLGERALFEIVDKTSPGTVEVERILGDADIAVGR